MRDTSKAVMRSLSPLVLIWTASGVHARLQVPDAIRVAERMYKHSGNCKLIECQTCPFHNVALHTFGYTCTSILTHNRTFSSEQIRAGILDIFMGKHHG